MIKARSWLAKLVVCLPLLGAQMPAAPVLVAPQWSVSLLPGSHLGAIAGLLALESWSKIRTKEAVLVEALGETPRSAFDPVNWSFKPTQKAIAEHAIRLQLIKWCFEQRVLVHDGIIVIAVLEGIEFFCLC
jgi:hypothetical protein